FPDLALHPHDPYLERRWRAGLSVPALSDRAHAAHAGQGPGTAVSISVNGGEVDAGLLPTPEVAAVRELLRHRPVADGLVAAAAAGAERIGLARGPVLADEVRVRTPAAADGGVRYEARRTDFLSGELVRARGIRAQREPGVCLDGERPRPQGSRVA